MYVALRTDAQIPTGTYMFMKEADSCKSSAAVDLSQFHFMLFFPLRK